MNTVSLIRRLNVLNGERVDDDTMDSQIQLGIDGKLLWVERHATPHGWMVMLSPSALASCRKKIAKLTHKVEIQQDNAVLSEDNAVLSEDMYWQAYYMRFKLSLEKRKLTWSHQEKISCTTEQDVYEAHLTMTLLQDESVRTRVLAKALARPQSMLVEKEPTLTFFQQRISRMTSWVEGIIAAHNTIGSVPLSTVGIVCILYRLVQYTTELNALSSWKETDSMLGRIGACVHTLYTMLCTRFQHAVGGSLSMTAMDLQDPVEMVKTLLFDNLYTRTVVMDFSWLLFACNEIPRASDYLIHTAIHTVLWWRTELHQYVNRYTHTMIQHTTPVENNNYCLLKLLLESVRADDKIMLYDAM